MVSELCKVGSRLAKTVTLDLVALQPALHRRLRLCLSKLTSRCFPPPEGVLPVSMG